MQESWKAGKSIFMIFLVKNINLIRFNFELIVLLYHLKMKLNDALPLLENVVGIRFGDLFKDLPDDLKTNKGNVGQLLLIHIGLKLDSNLKDFDDGELKTNKSDQHGKPRETMFITQVSRQIDDYVSSKHLNFRDTQLFDKIQNLVFLPVCKDSSNREDWFFVSCNHINLLNEPEIYSQIEYDYNFIVHKMKKDIETSHDKFIHTSSGKFIQLRSKDSKPYHPIFSKTYNRLVSNKNHAFYFKKEFMLRCQKLK
jgi:DNA mismatch repair protein MutH